MPKTKWPTVKVTDELVDIIEHRASQRATYIHQEAKNIKIGVG